jgi:hypothetical protein
MELNILEKRASLWLREQITKHAPEETPKELGFNATKRPNGDPILTVTIDDIPNVEGSFSIDFTMTQNLAESLIPLESIAELRRMSDAGAKSLASVLQYMVIYFGTNVILNDASVEG